MVTNCVSCWNRKFLCRKQKLLKSRDLKLASFTVIRLFPGMTSFLSSFSFHFFTRPFSPSIINHFKIKIHQYFYKSNLLKEKKTNFIQSPLKTITTEMHSPCFSGNLTSTSSCTATHTITTPSRWTESCSSILERQQELSQQHLRIPFLLFFFSSFLFFVLLFLFIFTFFFFSFPLFFSLFLFDLLLCF